MVFMSFWEWKDAFPIVIIMVTLLSNNTWNHANPTYEQVYMVATDRSVKLGGNRIK